MGKKEINDLIPAELKAKLKTFLSQFNIGVQAQTPPAPVVQAPIAQPVAQTQPVTLQESTLADGTVIKYDTPSLAVGSIITIVSLEGEMPAPVGEHKLQDGTVIKVGEGGKVEAVTPGTPEAPVAPIAQSIAPQLAQMKADYEQKFAAVTKEKEQLTAAFETQKTEFKALENKVSEFMILFREVLELPTANPIEKPKNKTENKIDRFINRK